MKTRFELTQILFQQQRLHDQTETHHNKKRMLYLIYVYKDQIDLLMFQLRHMQHQQGVPTTFPKKKKEKKGRDVIIKTPQMLDFYFDFLSLNTRRPLW